MHLNSFQKYIATTISEDVSLETVAVIKENMSELQGISIGEESLRVYPDSEYFAAILGYTGKISQDEYDAMSDKQKEKYALKNRNKFFFFFLRCFRLCRSTFVFSRNGAAAKIS